MLPACVKNPFDVGRGVAFENLICGSSFPGGCEHPFPQSASCAVKTVFGYTPPSLSASWQQHCLNCLLTGLEVMQVMAALQQRENTSILNMDRVRL